MLPDQFNFKRPSTSHVSIKPRILHYSSELKPWKIRGAQRTRLFCAISSTPFYWYKKFWLLEKRLLSEALQHSSGLHEQLEAIRVRAQRTGEGTPDRIKRKLKSMLPVSND